MSFHERVNSLRVKHQSLEREIEEENARPRPDDLEIARLKKEKLQIKDQIANLTNSKGDAAIP